MFVMTPAIFEEYRHTLSSTFEAQGTTCRALGMRYDCIGCIFVSAKECCFLERSNKDYQLFLEQHPEFLV